MSSHLPVELLRLILDNFRLPKFSSYRRTLELEDETRATLYALSITSYTLRLIARPLLYEFIRIRNEQQLSQLVKNNSSNNLSEHLKTLVFDHTFKSGQFTVSSALPSFALRLEQLIGYGGILHWLCPPPSSLRRLHLHSTMIDPKTISKSTFPSLEVLGLFDTSILPGSLVASHFPALRHVYFDSSLNGSEDQRSILLSSLVPQLHSVGIMSDEFTGVVSAVPSVSIASMLISLPWKWSHDFEEEQTRVVHLRLLIADIFHNTGSPESCIHMVEKMSLSLADRTRYSQLESIYLPPLDSLPPGYHDSQIVHSLQNISHTCQSRSIEVIYEEQSEKESGESQISEEFMRRMTKKRIEREAQE